MNNLPQASQTFRPQLDALRGLAVATIVLFYVSKLIFGDQFDFLAGLGIGLLFTLSGFLVTESLMKTRLRSKQPGFEKRKVIWRFYLRRMVRVVPLYCLVVGLAALYSPPGTAQVREYAWWLATFTENIGVCLKGNAAFGVLSHLWSLSVGAQLYLVWPWFLLFARRGALIPVTLLLIALGPLYRWTGANTGYNADQLYQFTVSWCDSFGVGALLAMTRLNSQGDPEAGWFLNRVALPVGLVATVSFLFGTMLRIPGPVAITFFSTACSLVLAWLILHAITGFKGRTGAFLELEPVLYVGKISFGIFMFYPLVSYYVNYFLFQEARFTSGAIAVANPLLCIPITLAMAALSWHLLERPIVGLKARLAQAAAARAAVEQKNPAPAPTQAD